MRTDVYAFGIILLQLISGQKVVDPKREKGQQSLRQWVRQCLVLVSFCLKASYAYTFKMDIRQNH